MKKLSKILIVSLTLISIGAFSQTTLEEYNYVTKGYKVQTESGLDMKKGYEFADVAKESTSERRAELKILYRTMTPKKEIAAYMIVYYKADGPKDYICIPHPKSEKEIRDKFWEKLSDGSSDVSAKLQLIIYLMNNKMTWQ